MYIFEELQKELNQLVGSELTDISIIAQIKTIFNKLKIHLMNSLLSPFPKVDNGYITNCEIEINDKHYLIYLTFVGKKKSSKISIRSVGIGREFLF